MHSRIEADAQGLYEDSELPWYLRSVATFNRRASQQVSDQATC